MMRANEAMRDAVFLMTDANAFRTGSVRRIMDSACRMTAGDRYVTALFVVRRTPFRTCRTALRS